MEFKGTKGKWAIENVSNPNGSFYKVKVDNSESICNITTRDTERSRLNAQLIAAAPELLDALIRLRGVYLDLEGSLYGRNITVNNWHLNGDIEHIDNFFEDLDLESISNAKTVIAKALGKEADSE